MSRQHAYGEAMSRDWPIVPAAKGPYMVALAGVFLVRCVLTKSLPYVLAGSDSELAPRLNSDGPAALLSAPRVA